jgi:hypothetical protein
MQASETPEQDKSIQWKLKAKTWKKKYRTSTETLEPHFQSVLQFNFVFLAIVILNMLSA